MLAPHGRTGDAADRRSGAGARGASIRFGRTYFAEEESGAGRTACHRGPALGNASCSTCHSYLDQGSFSKANEINDEEEDLLDMLDDTRHDTSRLSCQVEWSEELDGAEVTIAPEW